MSKSVTNQRLVYKIHSTRIRYNNWDLNLSFKDAKKNEEIVSLGDSIVLRMIRQINNNNITEEEIGEIKKTIKKSKKNKNNELTKDYSKRLIEQTLEKDYLLIIFDSVDDWNKANSKNVDVKINGKTFVRLLGTNGGIKSNTVVFVNKEIHEELDKRLNNGRDLSKKYVPAKFESYKALACSCSIPVTQPSKLLVIKDGITNIKADVLRLSDNGKGGFALNEVDDYEIERQFTDGCCMISPKLSEQWTIDMGEYHLDSNGNKVANYISTGFNIRNSWTKGMVFTFPYIEYADEINEHVVEDAWGDMVDIRNVDLIITTNMLKLWDGYESCEHYLSCCEENGFEFCVAKILPKELENTRNMNYQFLQSYKLSDEDIDKLIEPTIKAIKGAIGVDEENDIDYGKMLLFLKGNKITKQDFIREDYDYIKALMVEREMIKDPFIKQRIHKMIKKRIDDSKKGVIQINGNYSIVSGDLYALCQYMFKQEVTGLLKGNEFYAKTWLDKGVNKIVSYRAPMTIHNNIVVMELIDNEQTRKWYRYMTTCTVFNIWDTTMDAMNGLDFDGDAIISTDDEVLLRNTIKLKTVVCEQKSTDKKKITETLLRKANKNGFGNDVGSITNRCTSMFEVLAKFDSGTKEYDDMMYRVTCMQGYQQEIIDSCKGTIPKQVPKEWYDYKTSKINEETDTEEEIKEKEYNLKLLANKKPYFFIYNYKHFKNKYDKYIKNNKDHCLIKFGITIDELINKQNKSEDEIRFLEYYDMLLPSLNNGGVVSKICNRLEDKLNNILPPVSDSDFNKYILTTNKKISKDILGKLKEVYSEYKREVQSHMKNKKKLSKDEIQSNRSVFISNFTEQVEEICNKDYEIITNGLVELLYTNPVSKQFVWDICGDYIVDMLLKNNDYNINYPIEDVNGNIEWNGIRYSMTKEKLGGDIYC